VRTVGHPVRVLEDRPVVVCEQHGATELSCRGEGIERMGQAVRECRVGGSGFTHLCVGNCGDEQQRGRES
jgi:hypothetical protein